MLGWTPIPCGIFILRAPPGSGGAPGRSQHHFLEESAGGCSLEPVSYVALQPSYYQMFQPEGAWHAGAEGWSVAPYPGWGQNPALVGPKRLGVEGISDLASPGYWPVWVGAALLAGFVVYKVSK